MPLISFKNRSILGLRLPRRPIRLCSIAVGGLPAPLQALRGRRVYALLAPTSLERESVVSRTVIGACNGPVILISDALAEVQIARLAHHGIRFEDVQVAENLSIFMLPDTLNAQWEEYGLTGLLHELEGYSQRSGALVVIDGAERLFDCKRPAVPSPTPQKPHAHYRFP